MTHRVLAAARAGATLIALGMAILGAPTPARARASYAIVRTVDQQTAGPFDPREVVRGTVILTLPFDAAGERTRWTDAGFMVN